MWVYRKHVARRDENDDPVITVWQVGYFIPRPQDMYPGFHVVQTCDEEALAADRVHYLNGGN